MSKRHRLLLLGALVVATFLPMFWTGRWFDRWDSAEYVELSRNWSHEKRLPLLPMAIHLVNQVVPDASLAGKIVSRVCGSALVVAVAALCGELFGATAGLVAALLLATCPLGLFLSSITYPLPLLALIFVLTAGAVVRHVQHGRLLPLVVANLLVALAGLTRPEGFMLVPLVLAWDVVAIRRATHRARTAAILATTWLAQAGAVAFFLRHFGYGELALASTREAGNAARMLGHAVGYLRLLPSLLSYATFPLVAFGAWSLFRSWRRGELTAAQRAFVLFAAWIAAGTFAFIVTWYYFAGAYVFTAMPWLCAVAAIGLERAVARLAVRARPALVRGGVLAVVVAVNLPLAAAELANFSRTLTDEHAACVWLQEHVGTTAAGRREAILAIDPAHLVHWTGLAAPRYERAYVDKARWIVLDDVVLDHFGRDFDAEIEWLRREKGARLVFSAETELRTFFATTLCKPYAAIGTPRMLDLRFDLHHFRAAVLEMPHPTARRD